MKLDAATVLLQQQQMDALKAQMQKAIADREKLPNVEAQSRAKQGERR